MKIFNFKKNRILFKVLCTGLILLFSFQNSAYPIVRDLRDEGDISAFDVALAIISGFINGAALAEVEDVFKLSFLAKTYVLPVIASKVADKLGIENSIARAAFIMGFTAGIDAFGNKLYGSIKEAGKKTAKDTIKKTAKKMPKSVGQKVIEAIKNSSFYKVFAKIFGKIIDGIREFFTPPDPQSQLRSHTRARIEGSKEFSKAVEKFKEALKTTAKPTWKEAIKIGVRKAIQGAIQGAVEQAVYEYADKHLKRWWAELIGDSVGLFVGEGIEIAETEITGEKISYDEEKGIVVEKKEEGYAKKEIKEFFKKFGIRMSPQFLAALAREIGGKKEWGIVGSVFGNALVEKLFLDKERIEGLKTVVSNTDEKAPSSFTPEEIERRIGALNEEIKGLEAKKTLTEEEKERLKNLKTLRYYYQELRLSTKSFQKKLMDASIYALGGILLENISYRTPSPVHGAYFNLFLTSLFKSGIDIFRGNIPYDGGIKGAFKFMKNNFIYDAVQALGNFYSMGRLKPERPAGRGTRFKFTPEITYNPFFIDRLADYVRMGEKHGYLDAIISQYVSSLHTQSMLNFYQSYLLLMNQLQPVYIDYGKLLKELGYEEKLEKCKNDINALIKEIEKKYPKIAEEIKEKLMIEGYRGFDKKTVSQSLTTSQKREAIIHAILRPPHENLKKAIKEIEEIKEQNPTADLIKSLDKLIASLDKYVFLLENFSRKNDGHGIASIITNPPKKREELLKLVNHQIKIAQEEGNLEEVAKLLEIKKVLQEDNPPSLFQKFKYFSSKNPPSLFEKFEKNYNATQPASSPLQSKAFEAFKKEFEKRQFINQNVGKFYSYIDPYGNHHYGVTLKPQPNAQLLPFKLQPPKPHLLSHQPPPQPKKLLSPIRFGVFFRYDESESYFSLNMYEGHLRKFLPLLKKEKLK